MNLLTTAPASPPALDRLADVLASARRNLAPATWEALEMDHRAFARWCEATGTSPALPVPPSTVAAFLRAESAAGKAVATVEAPGGHPSEAPPARRPPQSLR